jgi:hypothetical protein
MMGHNMLGHGITDGATAAGVKSALGAVRPLPGTRGVVREIVPRHVAAI